MDTRTTPDGTELYLAEREVERGSKAPFLVAYSDPDAETRWGYYCSNCESFDTAMDSMGRIECNVCSNLRKATEWDAAHE